MRLAGRLALTLLIAGSLRPSSGAEGSGRLLVKTQDLAGRPLPGVLVEIEVPSSAAAPPAVRTGPRGTADFVLPLEARYVVRVSLAGFTPQSSGAVALRAGNLET